MQQSLSRHFSFSRDGAASKKTTTSKFYYILLIISILLNIYLPITYLIETRTFVGSSLGQRLKSKCQRFRTWPTWLVDKRPTFKLPDEVTDQLPKFRGQLSHLIFSLRDTSQELEDFSKTIQFWNKFPPCLADSLPTWHGKTEISLIIYFDSKPSKVTLRTIKHVIQGMSAEAKSCFAEFQIHHAGLDCLDEKADLNMEREHWRNVFNGIITGSIGLSNVNHAAILTAQCRPVQSNWLNQLDYQTRPPNDLVWMRGSIFRGIIERPPMDIGQLIRLSTAGIYFLADGAFNEFYQDLVIPWTRNATASENATYVPQFDDRWNVDIFQYLAQEFENKTWFAVAHQFRHFDLIGDYYGRNVSFNYLKNNHPNAVIICGNVIFDE